MVTQGQHLVPDQIRADCLRMKPTDGDSELPASCSPLLNLATTELAEGLNVLFSSVFHETSAVCGKVADHFPPQVFELRSSRKRISRTSGSTVVRLQMSASGPAYCFLESLMWQWHGSRLVGVVLFDGVVRYISNKVGAPVLPLTRVFILVEDLSKGGVATMCDAGIKVPAATPGHFLILPLLSLQWLHGDRGVLGRLAKESLLRRWVVLTGLSVIEGRDLWINHARGETDVQIALAARRSLHRRRSWLRPKQRLSPAPLTDPRCCSCFRFSIHENFSKFMNRVENLTTTIAVVPPSLFLLLTPPAQNANDGDTELKSSIVPGDGWQAQW